MDNQKFKRILETFFIREKTKLSQEQKIERQDYIDKIFENWKKESGEKEIRETFIKDMGDQAQEHYHLGQYEAAKSIYYDLTQIDYRHWKWHAALGSCCRELGDLDAPIISYWCTYALNPEPEVMYDLACTYLVQKNSLFSYVVLEMYMEKARAKGKKGEQILVKSEDVFEQLINKYPELESESFQMALPGARELVKMTPKFLLKQLDEIDGRE